MARSRSSMASGMPAHPLVADRVSGRAGDDVEQALHVVDLHHPGQARGATRRDDGRPRVACHPALAPREAVERAQRRDAAADRRARQTAAIELGQVGSQRSPWGPGPVDAIDPSEPGQELVDRGRDRHAWCVDEASRASSEAMKAAAADVASRSLPRLVIVPSLTARPSAVRASSGSALVVDLVVLRLRVPDLPGFLPPAAARRLREGRQRRRVRLTAGELLARQLGAIAGQLDRGAAAQADAALVLEGRPDRRRHRGRPRAARSWW